LGDSCENCLEDCPHLECGNGCCEFYIGEDPDSCPDDCPLGECGNGLCEGDDPYNESCMNCTSDCGICPPAGCIIEDGTCVFGETCHNCVDCIGGAHCTQMECDDGLPCCGNGICDIPEGETVGNCFVDCNPGLICGDGICFEQFGTETCDSCEEDCGVCPVCGDGTCELELDENCFDCAADCGFCDNSCGNGICDVFNGENCINCPIDECEEPCEGEVRCGDMICTPDVEDCTICPADCGQCCGDGFCDVLGGETFGTCSFDCPFSPNCGDGTCDSGDPGFEGCGEPQQCEFDCGPCPGACDGNGMCEPGENCIDCPGDNCEVFCDSGICEPPCDGTTGPETCGSGTCDIFENCISCPQDCGTCCGDGLCNAAGSEDCDNCPDDCGLCCGDGYCAPDEDTSCPEDCPVDECYNNVCEPGAPEPETCYTCPQDCDPCCPNDQCDTEDPIFEDCSNCFFDCPADTCGNGCCEPGAGENSGNCPEDCP